MFQPALKMLAVEPVGNYAIRINWSDGHSSGIYSYDHFREICQCAASEARRILADRPQNDALATPAGETVLSLVLVLREFRGRRSKIGTLRLPVCPLEGNGVSRDEYPFTPAWIRQG
jgi:hypothetical protein